MTKELMAHFCSRQGLKIVRQIEIDWAGVSNLDCLTLFEKNT